MLRALQLDCLKTFQEFSHLEYLLQPMKNSPNTKQATISLIGTKKITRAAFYKFVNNVNLQVSSKNIRVPQ